MMCQFKNGKLNRAILILFVIGGLAVLMPKSAVASQSVTFGWDPSTDPSIVGYNIYYGTASHVYTNKVSTGNTTAATISNLVEGATYYFAATTYDQFNQESVLSDEIAYTVPFAVVQSPPVFGSIPGTNTAAVGQVLALNITATGASPLNYSLGSDAPAGAWINPTNGLFVWTPQISQASTTNVITVNATDSGSPPLSASLPLTIIVQDYIHLSAGCGVVAVNSNGAAALSVYSSTPVTNLQFILNYPAGMLANVTFSATNPLLGPALVTPMAPGQALVNVQAVAGQSLAGLQTIGTVGFQAMAGQDTSVTYLNLSQASALRTDGTLVSNIGADSGRVTIVGQDAMMEAKMAGGARSLTVYGPVGASYQVETCNDLGNATGWIATMSPVTLTNLCQVLQLGPDTNAATFYRTRKIQ